MLVEGENKSNYVENTRDAVREIAGKLGKTEDASETFTIFTAAGTRANLTSKEKLKTSLGKIMKFLQI